MSQSATAADAAAPPFGMVDLALIGVVSFWGINFVIAKVALDQFLPLSFAALRVVLAALTLAAIVKLGRPRIRLTRQDRRQIFLLGLVGFGITPILFINGLARTTATNTAIMQAMVPILVGATNHICRLERMSVRGWTGAALSLMGIAMVIFSGSDGLALGSGSFQGNLLMLAAIVGWASYIVMARPLLKRLPAEIVTTNCLLIGAAGLVIVASPSLATQDWSLVTPYGWTALALSGLFSLGLCNVVWSRGIQRLGGTRTSLYGHLTPVVAVSAGILFLQENLVPAQMIGAACVVAGIFLTRHSRGQGIG